jgi:hypothetical protein
MKAVLRLICAVALALTLLPACFVYGGQMGSAALKPLMLAGTILWFAAATAPARLPRAKGVRL